MDHSLRIGDIIEAPPVKTVIRLEEGLTESQSIADNFVFTDETRSHFDVFADALIDRRGQGYFLQGDFGSGKSHFLAALLTFLSASPGQQELINRHQGLAALAKENLRLLTVHVSLVNFRANRMLEHLLVEGIETALMSAGVKAVLTPYAAFWQLVLDLLTEKDLMTAFAARLALKTDGEPLTKNETANRLTTFFKTHPQRAYQESLAFLKTHQMALPFSMVTDRYETFETIMQILVDAEFDGLVLIIDELSEFFRSKPDARALNEDARTLQLLGELTRNFPVWIIAAVQESIERTGDIAQLTFRKIKDRFPVKLILSTLHIKDLIAKRLVRHKQEAAEHLFAIFEAMQKQFPSFNWSFETFSAYYPVHPHTIHLLEGLGDLFSIHRGVVDFIHARIAGDPKRKISGILDRPCYELLGPDSIYVHFEARIAEFSMFNVYPRHVVPHLYEVIEHSIEEDADKLMARRIIQILVLYGIHPTEEPPDARRLTEMVACALSEHDPDLNVQFVTEAILDVLVDQSRFLTKTPPSSQDPFTAVYQIITKDDPVKALKARITQAASEIPADDTRLLSVPIAELPESSAWPGMHIMASGMTRSINWRKSSRNVFVGFPNAIAPEMEPAQPYLPHHLNLSPMERIKESMATGEIDFTVIISIGPMELPLEHAVVWEIPREIPATELPVLRDFLATQQIASALTPGNPAEAPLIQAAKEMLDRLKPAAFQSILTVFYNGRFLDKAIQVDPVIRQLRRFNRLLESAGEHLLDERYPAFQAIAPRHISPFPRIYQRLLDEFIGQGQLSLQKIHQSGLAEAIEGLIVPLGLVELKHGTYLFAPDPEKNELLQELFRQIQLTGLTPLGPVLQSLKTGRFGLPADTAAFLIAALAMGGIISLNKNRRTLPLEFIKLNTIDEADAIAPGEVIAKQDRKTLIEECSFLSGEKDWQAFGLRQQREAWQEVIKFKKWSREVINEIEKRLSTLAEFRAFASFDMEAIQTKINKLEMLCEAIKVSHAAREGLERFVRTFREQRIEARDIEYAKQLRKFLASHAEQFVFMNHYLNHSAIDESCRLEPAINAKRDAVRTFLDHPDRLIMDETHAKLAEAFETFRTEYGKFYAHSHATYYHQSKEPPLAKSSQRALLLLKRLAAIEILDRPAGLAEFLQYLTKPRQKICGRNLNEEIMRSPVCGCGYVPGISIVSNQREEQAESPDRQIENYVTAYWAILKNPVVREAISARIFALTDAEPETADRLRKIADSLADDDAPLNRLFDLLDADACAAIGRSLTHQVAIRKRRLKDLNAVLSGRRLTPVQVVNAVESWMAAEEDNAIIAIEPQPSTVPSEEAQSLDWWPYLHPYFGQNELLREARQEGRGHQKAMAERLERQFPAARLTDLFKRLSWEELIRFIIDEPFHTEAVKQAFILLVENALNHLPASPKIGRFLKHIQAAHVDPATESRIVKRLLVLAQLDRFAGSVFPEKLRLRLPLSRLWTDAWLPGALQENAMKKIKALGQLAEEWLTTLPAQPPISLDEYPMVIIFDGISPDVWLDVMDHDSMTAKFTSLSLTMEWFRPRTAPLTVDVIAEMFGLTNDPMDAFDALEVPYYQVKGNESQSMLEFLPSIAPGKAVVIRVALIDKGAHAAQLRLTEMPMVIRRFLKNELDEWGQFCQDQHRRLILTTDHGISLTPNGLTHGRGGAFERAIFRMTSPQPSII